MVLNLIRSKILGQCIFVFDSVSVFDNDQRFFFAQHTAYRKTLLSGIDPNLQPSKIKELIWLFLSLGNVRMISETAYSSKTKLIGQSLHVWEHGTI